MGEQSEIERIFLREARARAEELSRAIEAGVGEASRDRLFRHAHSLKGLAGSFGHEHVAALAEHVVHRLQDPLGRPRPLTRESEAAVREDVCRLVEEIRRLPDPHA